MNSSLKTIGVALIFCMVAAIAFFGGLIDQRKSRQNLAASVELAFQIEDNSSRKSLARIFTIRDHKEFQSAYDQNYSFLPSSALLHRPSDFSLDFAVIKVANYVANKPQKLIVIQGWFDPAEQNNTPFNDLGLARAESLKKVFLEVGIQPNQIECRSKE